MSNQKEEVLSIKAGDKITLIDEKYLDLAWNPKEDITAYELAQCMGILLSRSRIPEACVDRNATYMRHFDINN